MKQLILIAALFSFMAAANAQKGKNKGNKATKEWKKEKDKDNGANSDSSWRKVKHDDDRDDDNWKKGSNDSLKVKKDKEKKKDKDKKKQKGEWKEKDKKDHHDGDDDKDKKGNDDQPKVLDSKNIPTPVKDAFAKDYPNATNVTWSKSGGDWKATFTVAGMPLTATYHANGSRH